MTMNAAFLERLAMRETGRRPVDARVQGRTRLVVYSRDVYLRDLVRVPGSDGKETVWYLPFDPVGHNGMGLPAGLVRFGVRLLRLMRFCDRAEIYWFSSRNDWPFMLMTAVCSRLTGVPVTLHDYQFRSGRGRKARALVSTLVGRLELGDSSGVDEVIGRHTGLSFRVMPADLSRYGSLAKKSAVPRVIVYGDFEEPRVLSLIRRTHELVKQKYPRTEFVPAVPAGTLPGQDDGAVMGETRPVRVEDDLVTLLASGDMVMLLSRGGINRCFICRAAAAGYPVISNGIEYAEAGPAGRRIIVVTRDSYSSLAEAVIRLVDDESYYQSFARA